MVRNQREWPLALRFALLTIPAGICLAFFATWIGYRASSAVLHDSLATLPLLEAKIQAARIGETLNQLRHSMIRITRSAALNAQELRENLHFYFQDNAELVQEIGFKDGNGAGFMLLRDKGALHAIGLAEASQGPYSPFQQIGSLPLQAGGVTLYPPVYFDDPSAEDRDRDARVPVMRMVLQLPDKSGILVLGINLAHWRNKFAAFMQPGSPLRMAVQDNAEQLSFFFDAKGWILFEMDSSGGRNYLPDLARAGYAGDLGRPGYDAAFRPWTSHEDYWRMVMEVEAGRAGSIPASAEKYSSAHLGATGFLCFAPVLFASNDHSPPRIIGGIAFFETSTLPLTAFLRLVNFSLGILGAAFLVFGCMAFLVGKKLASPLSRMADDLSRIVETGELELVRADAVFEEQQRCKAAINHIIADAVSARHDLELLAREIQQTRSRLPVDLLPTLGESRPAAEFGLIGSSPLMCEVREHVRKAARAGTDVLIWGETGTGKELVAAAIHKAGSRGSGPYISINCGALDENLLLDALFGHVKGAFTEAKTDRKGAFLSAHGGTLHLDEIANASLKVQQALLRSLSVRRIRALGTDQEQAFDTRVVAATNVDLRECVRAGTFREDLYYRLAIISIETPPLRHRKEDIPELAASCIHEAAAAVGRPEARLSRGALDLMYAYDWPGNVRELKNCLTRAMAFVDGDLILPRHISLEQDAFHTYTKPLPPQVLAEKIHPAAPVVPASRSRAAPWDLSSAPVPEDFAQCVSLEPDKQMGRKAGPVTGGMGHAAEYLWPAPPREAFTPALDKSAGPTAGGPAGENDGTAPEPEAEPAPLSGSPFLPGQCAERENGATGLPVMPLSSRWLVPSPADNPPASGTVGSAPPAAARRAAGRQAISRLAAARLAAERRTGGAGYAADSLPENLPGGAVTHAGAAGGLNERQLRALDFVRKHGEITRSLYEEVAGRDVSARTAQNDLRELTDRGILKRVGAGPGTRYVFERPL